MTKLKSFRLKPGNKDMQDLRVQGEVKTTANGNEMNKSVAQATDWSETRGGKIHRITETLPLVAHMVLGKKLLILRQHRSSER